MPISVNRKDISFQPDSSRVLARFFNNGEERTKELVARVSSLSPDEISRELNRTLREFAGRHRNISRIFVENFENHLPMLRHFNLAPDDLAPEARMLIGSYATMEYAIESAAMFNPSIVEDFDQSFLSKGEKRVIISFRATGEGHLSSIVFRQGILDINNDLSLPKVRTHIDMPKITNKKSYDRSRFLQKMQEMDIPSELSRTVMEGLPDRFDYHELKEAVKKIDERDLGPVAKTGLEEITWLVDSYYDLEFSMDSDISERVIFPISPSESRGIEDARFVRFKDDDGSERVYATYTAYDGHTILPKLLSTEDFVNFRIMPMHGKAVQNKNFALFPRKIKGQYAVLARIDGVNNYIMFSDRITLWNDPIKIQEPRYPWEFTQIGNCGAPIYTEEGWLVITHGVGTMRRYCIGAALFDLDDPTREIGRLSRPLLSPLESEREGYVPNVVYSCGALVHNGSLVLPYAVSDYASSYATIDMGELLTELKNIKE